MAQWYIDEKGYRRFSDSGKLVHRWVAEKKLGRPIRRKEVVHHLNREKLDNNSSNLYVFRNRKAHERAHKEDNWW